LILIFDKPGMFTNGEDWASIAPAWHSYRWARLGQKFANLAFSHMGKTGPEYHMPGILQMGISLAFLQMSKTGLIITSLAVLPLGKTRLKC